MKVLDWMMQLITKKTKASKEHPEVEYFELRSKEGELLTNKSEINSCLKSVS